MAKHYFTFGQNHAHHVNGHTFDKDCVVVIDADTPETARNRMFQLFGPKFAFQYSEETWKEENMQYFPRGYIDPEEPAL